MDALEFHACLLIALLIHSLIDSINNYHWVFLGVLSMANKYTVFFFCGYILWQIAKEIQDFLPPLPMKIACHMTDKKMQ